jgi:hypothetical protein
MDSDFVIMMVVVSLIMLAIQCVVFAWDNWGDKSWHGLTRPIRLTEVFRDWIAYVVMFTLLSVLLRSVFCLACSYCERC